MSSFTDNLIVSPLPDGKRWVVRRAFRYYVGEENSAQVITVPAGFITDFASIPRLFWRILPKWGKYGNAAVVHDFLYWDQTKFDRKHSDVIFLEAMNVLKVPKRTARMMYRAVRMFGGKSWKANMVIFVPDKFVNLTGESELIERIEI